ncbi:MAG TPA: hypothetical protein VMG82_40375 [Candidatus Sulfotelmatobacter sp.]|nr:hypothetical protein [Candidatus Sulfotelmatobacter sp.]
MRRFLTSLAASVILFSISYGQDQQSAAQDPQGGAQEQQPAPAPPSLGEIARQLKLKKQQKEAQVKQAKQPSTPDKQASDTTPATPPAKTAHLVTDDDNPERANVTPVSTRSTSSEPENAQPDSGDHQAKGEQWKAQILQQKSAIAALQEDIKTTSESIHYAGANCVANCAQWNEKQQQKQQEVDTMKAQLEQGQRALEDMQEAARKEGFGGSVYDP